MGQRRKHVTQSAVAQDVQPPQENQHIVRALGSRGGNIVEVQYPDGATTLCMMPAKFNRKLWVRRGGFLIIESSPEAEQDKGSRVTGTICAVLYDEHIKQLKKMPGVWPPEFASAQPAAAAAGDPADAGLPSSSGGNSSGEDGSDEEGAAAEVQQEGAAAGDAVDSQGAAASRQQPQVNPVPQPLCSSSQGADGQHQQQQQQHQEQHPPPSAVCGSHAAEEDQGDSDDGLPPLQRINNRRVIHHYYSESEEED